MDMARRFVTSEVRSGLAWAGLIGAAAASLPLHATPAHACGGFFCSQAAPVVQAGEEIIFVDNPDDTVTAVIRIQYTGPAEKFAWVLPITGAPSDVAVSSNVAFTSLRQVTDPQYFLNTTTEGECRQDNGFFAPGASPPTSSGAGGAGGGSADGGVGVVAQGSVGPYDWHVINVDEQLPDAADVAVNWLVDEGYDVTDLGPDVLRPYLESGLNLMAFKLTKAASVSTGSIRPVVVTFESDVPSIPIRPTAVAAQSDMGILVWVIGETQAIPSNYRSLVVNEALINWFSYRQNYQQVVTQAADEAGGQGFVTEMADSSALLKDGIFSSGMEQQWLQYSRTPFIDGFDMIQQAGWQYSGWDGWTDAVCAAATLPNDVTCAEFASNPEFYRSSVTIDQTAFMRALYEDVVRPVMRTQDLLLSRPYFTRLFSTMSAEEMTVDPAFDFNPDLADVSNVHLALQIIECSPDVSFFEAPWRIELPQGGTIRGSGQQRVWPFALADLPANRKIVQLGTRGPGRVMQDNSEEIDDALFEQSRTAPRPAQPQSAGSGGVPIGSGGMNGGESGAGAGADSSDTPSGVSPGSSSKGMCSVSRVQAAGAACGSWLLFAAAAALLTRVRRRRR
jgi:hypothetical protein